MTKDTPTWAESVRKLLIHDYRNEEEIEEAIEHIRSTVIPAEREEANKEGYYRGRLACIEQLHGTKRDPVRALMEEYAAAELEAYRAGLLEKLPGERTITTYADEEGVDGLVKSSQRFIDTGFNDCLRQVKKIIGS